MKKSVVMLLLFALLLPSLPAPALSADLESVELGILVIPVQYPCPVRPKTSQWAANDWDTHIVVHTTRIAEGDKVSIEVTTPNNRLFRRWFTWGRSDIPLERRRGCTYLFVPILGTDGETWLGTWKVSVLLNDRKVKELTFEVVAPREGALAEYKAYLDKNPKEDRAHYRVGAAAALAGQYELAETALQEAIRIAPTWLYPYLALGRVYFKQGKKDLARESFRKLRGLLLGRRADPGTFLEYINAQLEDYLKQLAD